MSRSWQIPYLGLTLALGYAVFHRGGVILSDWNVCLFLLGLSGLVYWWHARDDLAAPMGRALGWPLLLLPCYVAFQLLPLPLWLLKAASPARAQLVDALAGVMQRPGYASLSVAPSATFVHLLRIAGYSVVFLLVRELAGRLWSRPWLLALPLIVIAALQAGLGIVQYGAGAAAVAHGTYGNRNHFAGLLEMGLPFAVLRALALLHGGGLRAAVGPAIRASAVLSIAAVMFLGIVYSMSRMGFVAALCSLFVIAAVSLGAVASRRKRALAIAVLAFLFLLGFVFLPPDELTAHFAKLTGAGPGSGEARLPIWKDTLRLIADYPAFGCGLGNYESAFQKYQTASVDQAYLYAHNDYLELLAEAGAIGFLIPAALMLAVLGGALRGAAWSPKRDGRLLGLAGTGAMTALLLHSLADFNLYIPANALAFSWIAGIAAGLPLSAPSRSRLGTEYSAATVREREWSPGFFRKVAIGLSCLLVVYSSAWMVFDAFFLSDRGAERLFCRFGICSIDTVLAAEQLQHGGGAIPPLVFDAQEAVQREAAAPYRWLALGEALLQSREAEKAHYAVSRALALGPDDPPTLLRAADFYFGLGENRKALTQTARVLRLTSLYDDMIFGSYHDRELETSEALQYGLPQDRRSSQAYIRYHMRMDRLPEAMQTWNWIAPRGHPDDRLAGEYVDFLLRHKNVENAARAWAGYLGDRRNGYPETNRLFNGDFELDSTGCAFDWAIGTTGAAQITLDPSVAHSGKRSLRIQFNGTENIAFSHVAQQVFVKPGLYRFEAYIRTEGITTDQGVGFRIFDREASRRLDTATESFVGTGEWTKVEKTFVAPVGTQLIEVQVVRKPSWKLDNKTVGTVWIDSVRVWEVGG